MNSLKIYNQNSDLYMLAFCLLIWNRSGNLYITALIQFENKWLHLTISREKFKEYAMQDAYRETTVARKIPQ